MCPRHRVNRLDLCLNPLQSLYPLLLNLLKFLHLGKEVRFISKIRLEKKILERGSERFFVCVLECFLACSRDCVTIERQRVLTRWRARHESKKGRTFFQHEEEQSPRVQNRGRYTFTIVWQMQLSRLTVLRRRTPQGIQKYSGYRSRLKRSPWFPVDIITCAKGTNEEREADESNVRVKKEKKKSKVSFAQK